MDLDMKGIADVPVARLAAHLQSQFSAPAHLDVEELALTFCRVFSLHPPVTLEQALAILDQFQITRIPCVPPEQMGGWKLGVVEEGRWVAVINPRHARTRQVQSVFHELYEILRDYFHRWGGQFPEGWDASSYRPEQFARWFAAAVTLPRPYVLEFFSRYGLDAELLSQQSGCSRLCAARRLVEVGHPDTQLAVVQCALPRYLAEGETPAFRVTDSIRSSQFSVRLDRRSGRLYHIPRRKEIWGAGPLISHVVDTGQPLFVDRVIGFDLFSLRDVSALAVPLVRRERVVAVTIYATPAASNFLLQPAAVRLEAETLPLCVGLAGVAQRRAPRNRRPRKDDKPILVPLRSGAYQRGVKWARKRKDSGASPVNGSFITTVARLLDDNNQLRWAFYEEDDGLEEFSLAA